MAPDSQISPVPSSPRSGRPARVVPAVGSPVRPDGEPGAPVRDAGLDRVLRAECVRRLQLRPLARFKVQGEFAGPDEEPKQHQVTVSHAASKGRYARFKENLNAKPLETKQNHHQVAVSCATSKGRHLAYHILMGGCSKGLGKRGAQWMEVISWEPRAFVYHNFLLLDTYYLRPIINHQMYSWEG
ncbi:hypothetical protein TRIUR3_31584 [Triticum urartu]|uniref:Uncharacterized protein n=1 Tax=Triticum urartu TaxID=4572 RepID=M7Z399_TRIUA|nr:hypothetical protein TRIUR3_31584 [Triticum urartu]